MERLNKVKEMIGELEGIEREIEGQIKFREEKDRKLGELYESAETDEERAKIVEQIIGNLEELHELYTEVLKLRDIITQLKEYETYLTLK